MSKKAAPFQGGTPFRPAVFEICDWTLSVPYDCNKPHEWHFIGYSLPTIIYFKVDVQQGLSDTASSTYH